jgi:hypothetical protein
MTARIQSLRLGTPRSDEIIGQVVGERMTTSAGLLFGRRTYATFGLLELGTRQSFRGAAQHCNRASRQHRRALPWPNSLRFLARRSTRGPDACMSSAALRRRHRDQERRLIPRSTSRSDRRVSLMIHPLVLGTGLRLFLMRLVPDLRLVEPVRTASGVLVLSTNPVVLKPRAARQTRYTLDVGASGQSAG